ncbi:MAG: CBS domain-containing protein [Sphingobacteriales bacterium]|jgi:acetoin utilization protein AcuB|nr:CBS domain-containing protein [Sphingobacteriales bacterium]MBP9140456.1 CBS domain-containing protein [Chitinophagales bacterium]MDA0197444.1 CBS domain-containing protein [Bacteroidota bacterium]MBK6891283.1 CBS domain-containing protein [Sphingobacteriales bacterium]MBK7526887.1 CBS domain-containing protein [Sphingobacteriales bacterium]
MNKNTKVKLVMSDTVIIANRASTFSQVCKLFLQYNLHHLPIVNDEDVVVGIISSTDVLRAYQNKVPAFNTQDESVLDSKISLDSIMTPGPITLDPEDTIGVAAEIFATHKLQALPVVTANNTIIGILTVRDLVRYFAING